MVVVGNNNGFTCYNPPSEAGQEIYFTVIEDDTPASEETTSLTASKPIEFGGMQISGLDLSKIRDGFFEDTLYLEPGLHLLENIARKPVKIQVDKNTVVQIRFQIAKKVDKLAIIQGYLNFSPEVTLKNPSAFAKKASKIPAGRSLKNSLFPIGMSGIRLRDNGSVKFEGHIYRLGMGVHINRRVNSHCRAKEFDPITAAKSIFKKFEAVVDSGIIKSMDYRFGLRSEAISLRIKKSGDEDREASSVNADNDLSQTSFALPNIQLSASALSLQSSGNVSFERRQNSDLMVRHNGEHLVKLTNPVVDYGIRARLNGVSKISLSAQKQKLIFCRDEEAKRQMLAQGKSHVEISLQPSEKTMEEFPRVRPFLRSASIELQPRGHQQYAQITPLQNGVTEFFSVVTNLHGRPHLLLGPNEKAPGPLGSNEMKAWVEDITGAKVRSGNWTRLITSGEDALKTRIHIADRAKQSLCVQTLVFKDDKEGHLIADALVRAAQRGVKVCVIVDSLGNIEHFDELGRTQRIYQKLREGGVSLQCYNNGAEKGMREILEILQAYPHIAGIQNIKDLRNPVIILGAIHRLALIARGKVVDSAIPAVIPALLAKALNLLFNGEPGANPQVILNELSKISEDNILDTSSLMSITERLAHFNNRWHEKYFVADNQRAIIGGRNLAASYLSDSWIDRDEEIIGPASFDIFSAFSNNWRHLTGEVMEPIGAMENCFFNQGCDIQIIQHRPFIDEDDHIVNVWLAQLKACQPGEKVRIENAYFSPTGLLDALERELISAQQRGVDICILTPMSRSDSEVLVNGAWAKRRSLLRAGIRIFETSDRMLHAKMATFGQKVSILGSANMDARSASLNSEDVAIIYDERGAKEKEAVIERDMKEGREIHLSDIEMLPLRKEVECWRAEALASLV